MGVLEIFKKCLAQEVEPLCVEYDMEGDSSDFDADVVCWVESICAW